MGGTHSGWREVCGSDGRKEGDEEEGRLARGGLYRKQKARGKEAKRSKNRFSELNPADYLLTELRQTRSHGSDKEVPIQNDIKAGTGALRRQRTS